MADISTLNLPDGGTYSLKDSTARTALAGKADSATTLAGYGITNAYTKSEVDSIVSSTYKAGGTVAFANLPALTSANLGYVYNISDEFTTTSNFVEGAGKTYPAGTNVAIVLLTNGTTYKYDVMSGFVDLSGYERNIIISATEPTTEADQFWLCDYT